VVQLEWTELAYCCLQDIRQYIALDNPKAAEKVVFGILNKAEMLVDFPRLGYLREVAGDVEIRITLYGHYRIPYSYKNSMISILGVYHGAMELERHLKA
jgi:toxin ParE1/3/4